MSHYPVHSVIGGRTKGAAIRIRGPAFGKRTLDLGPGHGRGASRRRRGSFRPGFTLVEALMAAGILLVIVMAVTSAILAGQQSAQAARERIAGALAAEEMMGRLTTMPYEDLDDMDGHRDEPGEMTTITGEAFPESFAWVGRSVRVEPDSKDISDLNVTIFGRQVVVEAFNRDGRTLIEIERFIPEPSGDF